MFTLMKLIFDLHLKFTALVVKMSTTLALVIFNASVVRSPIPPIFTTAPVLLALQVRTHAVEQFRATPQIRQPALTLRMAYALPPAATCRLFVSKVMESMEKSAGATSSTQHPDPRQIFAVK